MRILISGGPGSGCTATGRVLGDRLGLPVFDSDDFFHRPSDPPFQVQNSPEERRRLLKEALSGVDRWILSGSVATWEVDLDGPLTGVFLNVPGEVRQQRLEKRQREQFGERIEKGGDMYDEHQSFIRWAAGYEYETERARNLPTDGSFLKSSCDFVLEIGGGLSLEEVVEEILTELKGQGPVGSGDRGGN